MPVSTGLEGSALVAFQKTIGEREARLAALLEGPQVAQNHK